MKNLNANPRTIFEQVDMDKIKYISIDNDQNIADANNITLKDEYGNESMMCMQDKKVCCEVVGDPVVWKNNITVLQYIYEKIINHNHVNSNINDMNEQIVHAEKLKAKIDFELEKWEEFNKYLENQNK